MNRIKVVIVAKTHQGAGACIGGITVDGKSVRLIAADREFNDHAGQEYEVGDMWEVEGEPDPHVIPPHIENIIVHAKHRLPPVDGLRAFIERHMPPVEGGPECLFEGMVAHSAHGQLYISEASGVPPYSTMFWRPDRDLARDASGKRIHYRYPMADGGRSLTFVGFQEPPEVIPAGTLVRVSLAHWWRPADHPEQELRCYCQLSGWYAAGPADAAAQSPRHNGTSPGATRHRPDMAEVRAVLKDVFGFDDFLPNQEAIIANLLRKKDTVAVMPTGGGKSLCFQLPALLLDGLTVVVSPLKSLMQDQVDQLHTVGIPAAFLNSSQTYAEQVHVMDAIRRGELRLLYVAPETLIRPELLVLLEESRVDCLAIDEAHCISQWGHDFRPEYRQILSVRPHLNGAVILAVTATATARVLQDIKTSLEIDHADQIVASFDRRNLNLIVRQRDQGFEQLVAFLRDHPNQSGIVYCTTKKTVDDVAAALQRLGFSVAAYHADYDDRRRRDTQRAFSRDDVLIIVATIAFGMGINKSNVRFIVNYNLPGDLESYYQQIGRAGRDGLPADCLLLYSAQDIITNRFFFQDQEPLLARAAENRLQAMVRYAQTRQCRRVLLLGYFGETFDAVPCGACDVCLSEPQALEDLTVPAQKFLSCVKRTGELFGAAYIIDVLRGSAAARIRDNGHDALSTYGIGREFSKHQWQHFAGQFIGHGLVAQDPAYGGLKLTEKGWKVMKGEAFRGTAAPAKAAEPDRQAAHDAVLFERLRALRRQVADSENVPAYVVFSDRTLVDMATYFPQTPDALQTMFGVGSGKAVRYGPAFLALINDYCRETGRVSVPKTPKPERPDRKTAPAEPSQRKGKKAALVSEAYNAGQSVEALAETYAIEISTVLRHLWDYMQAGGTIRADGVRHLITSEPGLIEKALAEFRDFGPYRLAPIFDATGGQMTYLELHALRLIYVCDHPEALAAGPALDVKTVARDAPDGKR